MTEALEVARRVAREAGWRTSGPAVIDAVLDAFLSELGKHGMVIVPRDDISSLIEKARMAFYSVASDRNYKQEHDDETAAEVALCDKIAAMLQAAPRSQDNRMEKE